jgi:hypothetical protein
MRAGKEKRESTVNCEQVQNRLSAFLDDELSAPERSVMEDHLEHCTTCAGELKSLAAVLDFVDRWELEPEAIDIRPALRSATASSIPSGVAKPQIRPALVRITSVFRYAAALLLGISLGLFALGLFGSKPPAERTEQPKQTPVSTIPSVSNLPMENFDNLPEGSLGEAYVALLSADNEILRDNSGIMPK